MHISVAASAAEAAFHDLNDATAIVIDVLRATSVITTALHRGAAALYPAVEIAAARSLAAKWPANEVLLVGERNSLIIPGFDFGNSPLEFTSSNVAGKHIVITTSNGTRALQAALKARQIYIGCLLNAAALADALSEDSNIVIICAGTYNRLDISDCMAAGAIIRELQNLGLTPGLNDLGQMCADYFHPASCEQRIRDSWHGKRLLALDMEDDLRYCCQLNSLTTVSQFDGERITLCG